ncbi:D-alanyl-D-alanine carboxypeptidase family protein [Mycobacterium xenopi 4042]|uniref:D-alanyl-D-alanine carboxypeptidase family protein n=1 Tax=Mycobacterium xenopi 4042 TaxID=1299334 RepID=X8E930_MYCXE|nr:D-alanyl-D-alanine carboxypeptidase family protein [Mycobacterium xenopi 4042]
MIEHDPAARATLSDHAKACVVSRCGTCRRVLVASACGDGRHHRPARGLGADPDGPAQTWIVADLDSGQVLAARDENVRHPPASTIKVLLALVALDELNLDSTVVADTADTQVECSCVGVKPGRSYTARQLLDGLLLVSGNDAANTLARMLGGQQAAVAKMNAKAAALAQRTPRRPPPRVGRPAARAGRPRTTWPSSSGRPWPTRFSRRSPRPVGAVPRRRRRAADRQPGRAAAALPGAIGGKTGFTNAARKTFVGPRPVTAGGWSSQ